LRNRFRRPLLDDDAAVDEQHPVGDVLGECHFVGDDDHGHAVIGELAHDAQHIADQFGSSAEVGSSNRIAFGCIASAAGNRNTLLLSA
jgi:hypothetical protein